MLDLLVLTFTFCVILSIPLCSFENNYIFTWIFTILLLISMFLSLILFYGFSFTILSFAFIFFCLTSAISTFFNWTGSFVFTPIFLMLITFCCYTYALSNKKFIKPIIIVSYFGLVVFAFVFFFTYFSDLVSLDFTRLGTIFGNQNDIAIILGLGLSMSFYFVLFNKNIFVKIFSILLFLLFAFCGLSTGSKILFLIMIALPFLEIIMLFGKKRWYLSLILIVVSLAALIIVINIPAFNTIKTRLDAFISAIFANGSGPYVDYSTIDRMNMIIDGFNMFLRKPLFGFGIQGFHLFSSFGGAWSHNTFSEILSCYGVFGFIPFFAGFFVSFTSFIKRRKSHNNFFFFFAQIIFFLICSIVVSLDSVKLFAYQIGFIYAFFSGDLKVFTFDIKKLFLNKNKKISKNVNNENYDIYFNE